MRSQSVRGGQGSRRSSPVFEGTGAFGSGVTGAAALAVSTDESRIGMDQFVWDFFPVRWPSRGCACPPRSFAASVALRLLFQC